MKYLIFSKPNPATNLSDFEICNLVAAEFHHYPSSVGTKRYADPIKHPDGVKVAMPILDPDNSIEMWTKYKELFGREPEIVTKLTSDWLAKPLLSVSVQLNKVL